MALLLEMECPLPDAFTHPHPILTHHVDLSLMAAFAKLPRNLDCLEILLPLQVLGAGGKFQGVLAQRLPMGLGVLYRVDVDPQSQSARMGAEVLLRGERLRVRSNELQRNTFRTARWVSGLASRSLAGALIEPETGQVRVGLQAALGYNCA